MFEGSSWPTYVPWPNTSSLSYTSVHSIVLLEQCGRFAGAVELDECGAGTTAGIAVATGAAAAGLPPPIASARAAAPTSETTNLRRAIGFFLLFSCAVPGRGGPRPARPASRQGRRPYYRPAIGQPPAETVRSRSGPAPSPTP